VDPADGQQPLTEAEPHRRVVVAAGQQQPGAGRAQPDQRVVQQPHRVDRGQRPVVHVARHHDQVDPLVADDLHQVVEEGGLGVEQVDAVQPPAQVPVGGVEDAHSWTLGRGADSGPDGAPWGFADPRGSPRAAVRGWVAAWATR
jgi:hypothetical protein